MKWKNIFRDPDMVGQSEYLAIHDAIAAGALDTEMPDSEAELSEDQRFHIIGMLEEFRDWADALRKKCETVIICVRGGVAEVVYRPRNVTIELRDYDTEGCDPDKLEEDGSIVSVYGEEDES